MASRPLSQPNTYGTIVGTAAMSLLDTSFAAVFTAGFNDSALGWVNYGTDIGTTNNYAVTLTPAPSAYNPGFRITMNPANSNTGASVINANALGAQSIVDPAGNALVGSEILAGVACSMVYDGSKFRLVSVPIVPGTVHMIGGTIVQAGWLLCDGSAVSRTTFANLFAAISTNYGAGNGTTTFNVPNFNNAFPYGTTGTPGTSGGSSTISTANLPAHNHGISDPGHGHGVTDPGHVHTYQNSTSGAGSSVAAGSGFGIAANNTGSNTTGISINSNTTGITTTNTGSGTAYLPPYLTIRYIIKT